MTASFQGWMWVEGFGDCLGMEMWSGIGARMARFLECPAPDGLFDRLRMSGGREGDARVFSRGKGDRPVSPTGWRG